MRTTVNMSYPSWLQEVRDALASINMNVDEWQGPWPFDFAKEYAAGADPVSAADKANRFWWHEQNKAVKKECQTTPDCWLPRGHEGDCQPL